MSRMRPLRLHTKTTLLVSAITLAVLLAVLLLVSARMVNLVREDERALAQLQAISLAEQISLMTVPRDPEDVARAVAQARGSRPKILAVRLWWRNGERFIEQPMAGETGVADPLPDATQMALLAGQTPGALDMPASDGDSYTAEPRYRVFASVTAKGQVVGAVEVVERLIGVPALVRRYAQTAAWLALLGELLTVAAVYLLFRLLVYRPMRRLLYAMARAKAGSLHLQLPVTAHDEFGRLALGFNRMIERLRALTAEREAQQETLRQRVQEATEALQQRNDELAAANRELYQTTRRLTQIERLAAAGQTAAQFAHEVGTPLNSISIHVELLREALADNPEAARRTSVISEQIERIERIVRQMLDRTRTEKPVLHTLALPPLLEQVCATTEPTLQARRVRLDKTIEKDLPPVAGNADRLQQALLNLINNALDAMPDGGALQLTAARANGHVAVELTDTGCGMDAETQAHIFDPLYTTKAHGQGTGLGLVVTQQVMEEHGGQIIVRSAPGQGSTFRLNFPVAGSGGTRSGSDSVNHDPPDSATPGRYRSSYPIAPASAGEESA